MKEFVGLRAKTYNKFKSEDYKNCLKGAQLENKTNQQEKNKVNLDSLKKGHTKFIYI